MADAEPATEAPHPPPRRVDCTTSVYAPLDRPTKAPLLWLERAKRHAEALTAVAKHLADALEAEEKERPKALKRSMGSARAGRSRR